MRNDICKRFVATAALIVFAIVVHGLMKPVWSWGNPSCYFFLFTVFFVASFVYGYTENKAADGYIGCTIISITLCSGLLVSTFVVWVVSLFRG